MKSLMPVALALLVGAGWANAQAPTSTNQLPPPALNAQPALAPNAQPALAPIAQPALAPNNQPMLGQAGVPGSPMPGLSQAVNGCPATAGGSSVYFSADYLLWTVRHGAVPQAVTAVPVGLISVDTTPLLTTNPAVAPVPSPTTTTGFAPVSIISTTQTGIRSFDYGDQSGFRLTAGWWADSDCLCGIEASYFMLNRGGDSFSAVAAASGNQFLINTGFNRDVFLVTGGAQTLLSTSPVFAVRETTSATFGSSSNNLLGFQLNGRCRALQFGCIDVGCLVGARYVLFRDELEVFNQTRLFRPAGFPITDGDASASLSSDLTFQTHDHVRIYNNYVGGQVGADVDVKCGSFFVYSRITTGVGPIFEHANIDSTTQLINAGGGPTPPGRVSSGGLLAGPGDVGTQQKTRFGFVGEFNLKVGYQITDWFRAYVGYDGLYLAHFARAGASTTINSLNTNVRVANSTDNVSVSAPAFRFGNQDTWAEGLNFGFELNY